MCCKNWKSPSTEMDEEEWGICGDLSMAPDLGNGIWCHLLGVKCFCQENRLRNDNCPILPDLPWMFTKGLNCLALGLFPWAFSFRWYKDLALQGHVIMPLSSNPRELDIFWWRIKGISSKILEETGLFFFFVIIVFLNKIHFFFFLTAPMAYGGSQARGRTRATAAGLCHSHSNARSEPCLRPTPQLTATLAP